MHSLRQLYLSNFGLVSEEILENDFGAEIWTYIPKL